MIDLTAIAGGIIPETLEELTASARELLAFAARQTQTLAVIVAAAKRHNPAGWADWAADELGLGGSYLHHLRAVGDMLLDVRAIGGSVALQHYKLLFSLAYNKLVPLTRVPATEMGNFVRVNPTLARMSRDQVRAAVAEWLHEQPAARAVQLNLPGIDAMISFLDEHEDAAENVFSAAAASAERAQSCLRLGFGLIGGAAEYYLAHPDADSLAALQQLKAGVLTSLDAIDQAIKEHQEKL
ncbi:MAG: hypothetical protein VB042_05275 [Victivallaceae bacterium]|nr:hypothetical protein [Victivallaceae bacterium]